jgi:hypothetical protein
VSRLQLQPLCRSPAAAGTLQSGGGRFLLVATLTAPAMNRLQNWQDTG